MNGNWIGSAGQSQMIAAQQFYEQRFAALEERMKAMERLVLDRNANAAEPTPDRRGDVQQLLDMRRFLEQFVNGEFDAYFTPYIKAQARKALGK